jgi:hypothetical protein
MGVLELRFEHGASAAAPGIQIAEELARLARKLDVTTICRINQGSEMFAIAGEAPAVVLERWQRWEQDRVRRELDVAARALPISPMSPEARAARQRTLEIIHGLRVAGFEDAAAAVARTYEVT